MGWGKLITEKYESHLRNEKKPSTLCSKIAVLHPNLQYMRQSIMIVQSSPAALKKILSKYFPLYPPYIGAKIFDQIWYHYDSANQDLVPKKAQKQPIFGVVKLDAQHFKNRHFNLVTFGTGTYFAQWTASYLSSRPNTDTIDHKDPGLSKSGFIFWISLLIWKYLKIYWSSGATMDNFNIYHNVFQAVQNSLKSAV